jgi:hypothetical protein
MAKVKHQFQATITLNQDKGGGWLATYHLTSESGFENSGQSAWKNASAAKRWIKAKVQELTPRKSVKLTPVPKEGQSNPVGFNGLLEFRS